MFWKPGKVLSASPGLLTRASESSHFGRPRSALCEFITGGDQLKEVLPPLHVMITWDTNCRLCME